MIERQDTTTAGTILTSSEAAQAGAAEGIKMGWKGGAEAMKQDALATCDAVLGLLRTGVIAGKAEDLITLIRRQIENSPMAGIPANLQERSRP